MSLSVESRLAYLGFQLFDPGPALRPYVRSYWHFGRDVPLAEFHEEYMHPRGGFGIVFNFGDRVSLDSSPIVEPVFLDGTNTFSRKMGFQGTVDLLGVKFVVGGAYPVLAVPLNALRNEVALLDVLDRPALLALHGQLYEAHSLPARIALLEQWLLNRLERGKERHAIIPASLATLRREVGRLAVPALADQFAISQRQLERLFQSQVGMSPKQYTQLLRVEAARLALKQIDDETTTAIAAEFGFYDQAHFIREFSAVIGLTPYRYLERSKKIEET